MRRTEGESSSRHQDTYHVPRSSDDLNARIPLVTWIPRRIGQYTILSVCPRHAEGWCRAHDNGRSRISYDRTERLIYGTHVHYHKDISSRLATWTHMADEQDKTSYQGYNSARPYGRRQEDRATQRQHAKLSSSRIQVPTVESSPEL